MAVSTVGRGSVVALGSPCRVEGALKVGIATSTLRQSVQTVVPDPALAVMRRVRARVLVRSARRAFERAGREPAWLDERLLERLQREYPSRAGSYSYAPSPVERRGNDRARELLRLLPGPGPGAGASMLELGCRDGMVSRELQCAGASTTALDLTGLRFDERARRAGVRFVEGDAERLDWDDGCFDVVFSYNSFEHFPRPDRVLREAIRVTRPAGFIYLRFGPLYMSPFGLHAYHSIDVPYCHHLFEREAIARYVAQNDLRTVWFENVNGWHLGRFRDLWARHRDDLASHVYREIPYAAGTELIRRYPSCFRSKTDDFAELTTSHIQALFRRR